MQAKQKPKIEKTLCLLKERIEINLLNNKITDATINGSVDLKIKAKGIKSQNFILSISDKRWPNQQIFDCSQKLPLQLNIPLNDGETSKSIL